MREVATTYNQDYADSLAGYFGRVHQYGNVRPELIEGNFSIVPCTTTQLLAVAMLLKQPKGLPEAHNTFRDSVSCLIGPPGTGKTRTMFHAISALLHRFAQARAALTAMIDSHNVYLEAEGNAIP